MTENVDLLVISELLSESFGCMCLTVRLPQSATAVVCDIVNICKFQRFLWLVSIQ